MQFFSNEQYIECKKKLYNFSMSFVKIKYVLPQQIRVKNIKTTESKTKVLCQKYSAPS